jgi:alkyl hydroperoxide reductase subunit AhpC
MRVGGVLVVIVSYGRDFVLVLPTELDFYLT